MAQVKHIMDRIQDERQGEEFAWEAGSITSGGDFVAHQEQLRTDNVKNIDDRQRRMELDD